MGLMGILGALFGGNRNVVREVAEIFKVNVEGASVRGHDFDSSALDQFAAEFAVRASRTWWDSLVDGLNRLPRPTFTLGVFVTLVWTAVDPAFMAEVFAAWAIIPTPVWALITIIVTFFFGGRQQVKDMDFQRDVIGQVARTQAALSQRAALRDLTEVSEISAPEPIDPARDGTNPALDAFLATRS
jgi:hypothetical protein